MQPARAAAVAHACETGPWRRPMRRVSVLPGRACAKSAPAYRRGWLCRRRCEVRSLIQVWPWTPIISLFSSFRDARSAGPESILPVVVMDSGLALRAPRNDSEVVGHCHALLAAK